MARRSDAAVATNSEVSREGRKVRVPFLEIDVTPVDADELLEHLQRLQLTKERSVVVGHNLHSAYLYSTDTEFRQVYDRSALRLIDGFPIHALLRVFTRKYNRSASVRIGSTDWIPRLHEVAEIQRIAVVGGESLVNSNFVEWLARRYDKMGSCAKPVILGLPGANWSAASASSVVSRLKDFDADITLIGLGMPKQEHFIAAELQHLPNGIYALIGGAIDQLTGSQKNSPRWLGRLGLEWIWRLVTQPQRMWRRYLLEPWMLVYVLTKKKMRRAGHGSKG